MAHLTGLCWTYAGQQISICHQLATPLQDVGLQVSPDLAGLAHSLEFKVMDFFHTLTLLSSSHPGQAKVHFGVNISLYGVVPFFVCMHTFARAHACVCV